MANTLRKPAVKDTKRTRADWDSLIREREALNEQRTALDRESGKLKTKVEKLDELLVAFVEFEAGDVKEQQVTLKSFILSIIWKKPVAMTVAFAAYAKLTDDEKTELAAECGDKKKLDIQWREAPPAGGSAAASPPAAA